MIKILKICVYKFLYFVKILKMREKNIMKSKNQKKFILYKEKMLTDKVTIKSLIRIWPGAKRPKSSVLNILNDCHRT